MQQSTPLPASFNGLAGLQRLNPQKYAKPQAVLYSTNKNYLRKDDSAQFGSDSAHRTSNASPTKLHVNSNTFSQISTTPASSTIYKTSPLQHPLTTPYGKLSRASNMSLCHPPLQTAQGTWARTNITKAHAFVNLLASVFQPHPTNLPDEEEAPYQLEPASTDSNKPKFKQLSTTFLPKLLLATTPSRGKSSKNYLLLA
jgi:hypothetical protein